MIRLPPCSVAMALVLLACCHDPPRVVSFEVMPPQACKDTSVTVTWEVIGHAKLAIVPGTKNPNPDEITAKEQDVPSKGTQTIPVAQSTTFAIRAVDANQAKVQWQGKKPVDVPVSIEDKTVSTDCNPTSSKCTGKFTLNPPHGSMRVVRIDSPHLIQSGQSSPATVCITHDTLAAACIAPDKPLDTSVAADGEWTVETIIPQDPAGAPPPKLSIQVQFSCP